MVSSRGHWKMRKSWKKEKTPERERERWTFCNEILDDLTVGRRGKPVLAAIRLLLLQNRVLCFSCLLLAGVVAVIHARMYAFLGILYRWMRFWLYNIIVLYDFIFSLS